MSDNDLILIDMLSGAFAGFISTFIGYPLDSLKVRAQMADSNEILKLSKSSSKESKLSIGRMKSLYRGIVSPLFTIVLTRAYGFVVLEYINRWLNKDVDTSIENNPHPTRNRFISGVLTGVVLSVVTIPTNCIKVQLQTTTSSTFPDGIKGVIKCGQWLYKNEGIKGLYRGAGPQLMMETIGTGSYFVAYDIAKRKLGWNGEDNNLSMPRKIISGACAGIAGWITIYPFDVIKNRLQAQKGAGASQHLYKGGWDCAVKSYRAEGWQVFFRGLKFTLLRAAPVSATMLPTYDYTHSFLSKNVFGLNKDKHFTSDTYLPDEAGILE